MSLKAFHRVFILASFACLAVVCRWAMGANPEELITPWAAWTSAAGMALLVPYFVWTVRKL